MIGIARVGKYTRVSQKLAEIYRTDVVKIDG